MQQNRGGNNPVLPVIIGPTGVGKTSLAIKLAKRFSLEIVSMDSVMIYKGLDIGSAKPTLEERQGVLHHLIDVAEVTHPWSVGDYLRALAELLPSIYKRNHLPLLVGGTMLYYRAITYGLSNLPATDSSMYQRLQLEQEKIGLLAQYRQLQQLDPEVALQIQPQDMQRIHRALAVYYQTGHTLSAWQRLHPPKVLPYRLETVAINDDLALIRERIKLRFVEMMQQGWLAEVERLWTRYRHFDPVPRPLLSVGYRQIWDYYAGRSSYETMLERVPIVTGQLAKRQQTWLRSWPHIPSYSILHSATYSNLERWIGGLLG